MAWKAPRDWVEEEDSQALLQELRARRDRLLDKLLVAARQADSLLQVRRLSGQIDVLHEVIHLIEGEPDEGAEEQP